MSTATEQLNLFEVRPDLSAPEIIAPVGKTTDWLGEKFDAFRVANPHVEVFIVEIARELKRRGFERIGMKMIFENLRWRYALATRGSKYKLNNNYTSHYARYVMRKHPDLDGFFETRERVSA